MAKAFIVYGFIEGRWHGKRMRRALKRRGYDISRSLPSADIIIGHSGGCYDIPVLRDDQLLVLINPPYWPERTIAQRSLNMAKQMLLSLRPSKHAIFNANKTLHNGYYFLLKRSSNRRIARRTVTFNLEQEVKHYRTILIRNNDDPWLTPDLSKLKELNPHLKIIRLPSGHDDCWLNPNPYIDAIGDYRV